MRLQETPLLAGLGHQDLSQSLGQAHLVQGGRTGQDDEALGLQGDVVIDQDFAVIGTKALDKVIHDIALAVSVHHFSPPQESLPRLSCWKGWLGKKLMGCPRMEGIPTPGPRT